MGRSVPIIFMRAVPPPILNFGDPQPYVEARQELYDVRRFAMFDPYSDPREWSTSWTHPSLWTPGERGGGVTPERRDGWFLVSSRMSGADAMRALLELFPDTARAAFSAGSGVWEWLGVFGQRFADSGMVELDRLPSLYGLDALGAVGPASSLEEARTACEAFRAVLAVEAAGGVPWQEALPGEVVTDVLQIIAHARAHLTHEAVMHRRITVGAVPSTPSGPVDEEAAIAAAGRNWRDRADRFIQEADEVLAAHDGDRLWVDAASWSPPEEAAGG